MNQTELDAILKQARTPEISEESLAMFPRQIAQRLKQGEPVPRAPRRLRLRLAWAFALAACAVIAFWAVRRPGQTGTGAAPAAGMLASAKLIHETLAMFPNRVRAIVEDQRGISLDLSDRGDVPDSPPLYVRISDGRHAASFVTFSGQEIQAAGQKITVLADARGGIILEGNQFVWASGARNAAGNGLQIEARELPTKTL